MLKNLVQTSLMLINTHGTLGGKIQHVCLMMFSHVMFTTGSYAKNTFNHQEMDCMFLTS